MTSYEETVANLKEAYAILCGGSEHYVGLSAYSAFRCQCAVKDALELLKEQETRSVNNGDDTYVCGECGETVGWEELSVGGIYKTRYKYCPECGRAVKWE